MARKYWWSGVLPEQYAIIINVKDKIGGYKDDLGLTTAQVDRIILICEIYIAVYNFVESVRETAGSLTEWRDDYFYRKGDPTPPNPSAFATFTAPAGAFAGIVNEFKALRDLIVNLPGFTDAIGEDLMFLGPELTKESASEAKPTINTFSAATGYMFTLVVSNRGESDMWDAYIMKKGGSWTKYGTYNGKSVDITVTPTVPGEPEQIQVRVQLRKKNADYGVPSDNQYVTLNP